MASSTTTARMIELAATISNSVAKLHEILSAKGLPSPSFDEDAPTSLPKEASDAQDAVLDATSELHDLLLDPLSLLFQHGGVGISPGLTHRSAHIFLNLSIIIW